jgi:hypothetical protein
VLGTLVFSACAASHHVGPSSHDDETEGPSHQQDLPSPFSPHEGQLCSGGWCWEFPFPQGSDLLTVWVFGERDVWAAGSNATVIHWDGKTWSYRGPVAPGTTNASFGAMWASAPNDLWLWGQLGLYHWDGKAWDAMQPEPSASVSDVHGQSATDVWAVGEHGLVAHWDGRTWSAEHLETDNLLSVWSEGSEVWITGSLPLGFEDARGVLWHHDGSAWTMQSSDASYDRLWGSGKGDLYALGQASAARWDGTSFVTWDAPFAPAVLWGTSPDDLWAFDQGNHVQHYDGSTWSAHDLPERMAINAAAGTSSNDLWTVGAFGRITRWDGTGWKMLGGAPADAVLPDGPVRGVHEHEVWSSGENGYGLVRWDGSRWNREEPNGHYYAAGGSEPGTMCFIGSVLECRDGNTQLTASAPAELYNVWASSPHDVWAVGVGMYHHDGKTWTHANEPTDPSLVMRGVWGLSASDVWAVGEKGTILHYDGVSWTAEASGVTSALYAVWGASASDVWAAGASQESNVQRLVLVHWDGKRWSELESPDEGIPEALWGTDSTNLWLAVRGLGLAGGGVSRLLHWDGHAWTTAVVPSQDVFGGMSGFRNGSLDVSSNHGLLRYYPGAP